MCPCVADLRFRSDVNFSDKLMINGPKSQVRTVIDGQSELRRAAHDRVGAVTAVADENGSGPCLPDREYLRDLARTFPGI